MRHLFIIGLIIGLLLLLTDSLYSSPFTPIEWQQIVKKHSNKLLVGQRKHTTWVRDRDRDFIDDEIKKRHGKEDRVDIIVDLNSFLDIRKIQELFGPFGTLRYASKLITFVFLDNVRYEYLEKIAIMREVAMIEIQDVAKIATDVSTRSVQAKSSTTYSPNTAADANFTGSGITIAIIDTGVDDVLHEQFKTKYVGGFNALIFEDTNMNGIDDSCEASPLGNGVCTDNDDEPADGTRNPDDDVGHGTLVAGIALGKGAPNRTCRSPDDSSMPNTCAGVAPGAGLVDIKVCHSTDCPDLDVAEALDWLGLNYETFGVRVANMSFSSCTNSDGTDAMSQQVNYLAALGIVMVAAHGNSINCWRTAVPGSQLTGHPGSASYAVTVAGTNDKGTVDRNYDDNYVGYLVGPRIDFHLSSPNLLALKPDIAAPGQAIISSKYNTADQYVCDSGTSLAAPHVSGSAAIILEAQQGMDSGSVKDLLKRSADTSKNTPEYPAVDTHWDTKLGSGMLNVWAALNNAAATDVGFPTCSGPPNYPGRPCALSGGLPCWNNTGDISTLAPPEVGVANTIMADVRNFGTTNATVLVNFGVYVFAVGNNQFFHIGSQQRNIPAGSTLSVEQPWTPSAANHQCIQVSIDYGGDTNFDNNVTQRNLQVTPSVYTMRVENPFAVPAMFRIKPYSRMAGWDCRVENPIFTLHPYRDYPKEVQITFDAPRDARIGEQADCDVAVYARPVGKEKDILIGGVTVRTFVPKPCRIIGWVRDRKGQPIQGAKVIVEKKGHLEETQSDKYGFVSFEAIPYRLQPVTVITQKYGKQHAKVMFYRGDGSFEILVTEKGLAIEPYQCKRD